MFGKKKQNKEAGGTSEGASDAIIADKENIDFIFRDPEIKSTVAIEYEFPEYEGRELKPSHSFEFIVPDQFKGRVVRDVVLRHRKAEKYRGEGTKEYDPNGAYSRVELHDSGTGEWRQWVDPKGYSADKYAEWRSAGDPENENLHDWLATVGKISPDAARVTNVGRHQELSTSQIHSLEVIFYPELEGVEYEERIYTKGTSFIDIEKNKLLPTYGGGSHTKGIYENAIALNGEGRGLYPLSKDPGPDAYIAKGKKLFLGLNVDKKLIQIEVAVGDTEHLANQGSDTGRQVRLGWAKLWVGIKHADGNVDWFIKNANIPPQGVIAGSPANPDLVEGDELVIEAKDDEAYVMGWRVAYKEAVAEN